MGAVLRQLLTGVPPDRNVVDFISERKYTPLQMCIRLVRACSGRSVAHYRYLSEVPAEEIELLNRLMDPSPATRMTISQLSRHPWVTDAPRVDSLHTGRVGAGAAARA
mmetsp:Transcript_39962/g.92614  ORF Transcript_39962/g.92614 Transcript_39962/m.92614 type:complete len:108 (+) Transcript_39962:1000-1323(+)